MIMGRLDCLDNVRNLGELNRLLVAIEDYGSDRRRIQQSRLLRLLEKPGAGIGRVLPDHLFDLANHFRLVNISHDKIITTIEGLTFLNENPDREYNITEGQQEFLVKSILFGRHVLSTQFDRIVEEFRYNRARSRYEGGAITPSGTLRAQGIRRLCYGIGFIKEDEGVHFINPLYNTIFTKKIRIYQKADYENPVPSDEDLERWHHAEELIYEEEKTRLRNAGLQDLARRVQHIADFDAAAGYDVLSFSGAGSRPKIHDRYIEVKSSQGSKLHFFLSRKQHRKAKELGAQYSIVFIGKHDIGKNLKHCKVTEIKDPAREIREGRRLQFEARKLRIQEIEGSAAFDEY